MDRSTRQISGTWRDFVDGGCFYYAPDLGEARLEAPPTVHGGLLSDEMGMGKTVQAISLILASRAERKKDAKLGPTLVVAPTSAMWQWAEEIENFTNGSLKVLVYYTTREKVTKEKLLEHDVGRDAA